MKKKSKKIVIITGFFYPNIGGMEKQIDLWAHTLSDNGYAITIHTNALFHNEGIFTYNNRITLIRDGVSLPSWSQKAANWVADNCDDSTIIIIASLGKDIMPGMLKALKNGHNVGSRVILNIPTSDHIDRALKYKGTNEFLSSVDRLVSVSLKAADSLSLIHKDVCYVPNYLSNEEIHRVQKSRLPSKRTVAYFGRISARKRVGYLPIIASKLRPEGVDLFVQGPAGYGEEILYQKIKKELNKAGSVMIEPSPEPDERIIDSMIFINPSEVEGLSIALLEAMNRGNIPILSNIQENAIVVDNESLLCADKTDEYAKTIKKVFNMGKKEITKLQLSMRKKIINNYSEEKVKDALLKAILE